MDRTYTLCLNMIVKDESHIIIDTLTKLCSKIHFDYWVICDTGSSDNTIELIQTFFDNNKIKGEIHKDEWVDFGHNRTLALDKAFNKTDYLLVFDADDEIAGNFILPKNIFDYDAYFLNIGESVKFKRMQLVNNKKRWKYVGVLHEYIECLEQKTTSYLIGDYYVISGRTGNRSKSSDKYVKDAVILEKAYEIALKNSDDIHMRYSFYCANSYKDSDDIDNAIKWYKNTLQLNNWNQEKYVSCLNLYKLYEKKSNIEQGIYYLIQSHKYDSNRVECIYHLIKHYCIGKQNEVAYLFYTLIQNYYENNYINDKFVNKLFVCECDYSFFLPYYMIIVCERLKKYDIGLKMYDIIFTKEYVNAGEWWIGNLVSNLQFFIKHNKDVSFVNKWRRYLKLINDKNYKIDNNLVNKYEIYNTTNFIDIYSPNNKVSEILYSDNDSYIVLAILAKDKANCLPFYLNCIYNQTYNKKYIHLYIRTNDNTDNTESILSEFVEKCGKEYASVYFDNTSISESLKNYSNHEWNSFRFNILGKIRQDSVDYALKLKAHYFVVDCDNFIIPTTIEQIFKNKDIGVITPILRTGFNENMKYSKKTIIGNNPNYSNFHYSVTQDGYYAYNNNCLRILNNDITGLIRVCCVHCLYLIPYKYLSFINYIDNSNRYEYVIFSETLRKNNIPQYIDNTHKYGYLTFTEDKEEFDQEYNLNKNKYEFTEY